MSDLNIASVELVTSLRKVPMNGAPSSSDYNTTQREILADLADLADFVNEAVLPILQALPADAAAGLDGASLYADRTSVSPLFRDPQGNRYTVAQVLASIATAQGTLTQQMTDLSARISGLQTRLATTQQNDIRASVQSLQDSYGSLLNRMTSMIGDVASQGALLSKMRRLTIDIPEQSEGMGVIDVSFTPPFPDNNYAVSLALEWAAGLTVQSFVKKEDGAGLSVHLLADGTSPSGTLHVMAAAF